MVFKDLREFIRNLESQGEVQRIEKEVDWHLEVGAIIRRSYDLKSPAPFFQRIKGYPDGYTIFGAPAGLSSKINRTFARVAISLGFRPEATLKEIMEEYTRKKKTPIKPILVSSGPCKEEIHVGDEVDLFEFPVPYFHDGDGGRYISTWHAIITKDPETGWVNWGMYRQMIHDKNSMGGIISPYQDIGLHFYQRYEGKGKPMEFAVAIGTEPVTSIIAATKLALGVNEVDVIGALRGEPLELIKCETVDLEVPASSEIVLEGIVNPNERKEEGPFGEYTGYRAGERLPRPVYHVKAITHRKNPILSVSCMGVPVDDAAAIIPITRAAELLDDLRTKGFPVSMVYCPPCGVSHFTVVSTKVPYANYARQLANAIWGSYSGRASYQLVIVEEDVDVTNMEEVIWALTTRCHPDRGVFKLPMAPGTPLLPFLSLEEKRNLMGAQVLFDCTWPKDWPQEAIPVKASFDVLWPKEIQDRVLKNWKEYGYSE